MSPFTSESTFILKVFCHHRCLTTLLTPQPDCVTTAFKTNGTEDPLNNSAICWHRDKNFFSALHWFCRLFGPVDLPDWLMVLFLTPAEKQKYKKSLQTNGLIQKQLFFVSIWCKSLFPHTDTHTDLTCCRRCVPFCSDTEHCRWLQCHQTSQQPAGWGCRLRNPGTSHSCDSGRFAPATAHETH